jgi:hypothetical protein
MTDRPVAAVRLFCSLLLAALAAPTPSAAEDSPRLPVVTLRYENGLGYREMAPDPEGEVEEEPEMEAYSERHKLTLRLKEQWSKALTTNLYAVAFYKNSEVASDSYAYLYLHPNLAWSLSRRVKWTVSFRSKLTWFEPEIAPLDRSADLLGLLAKTSVSMKLHDRLKLIPSVQGAFDLYQDPEDLSRTSQTYTAALSLQSELAEGLDLTGRYRGSFRYPLGADSTVEQLFNNEFALALTWDPNS